LAKALVKHLRAAGHRVCSIARGNYPELESIGIETCQADIGKETEAWEDRFRGADGVLHTAAYVKMWGRYEDFFRTNVLGSRNIIECCKKYGVPKLVFTSSPSVVADGTNLCGVDESYPYPAHYDAYYPETKAQAEREVLSANSVQLRTIALRPHLIFGSGDTNLIPTLLAKARAGRLVQIGEGSNLSDFSYIEDCVQAHIQALTALESRADCGGRAYFVSQGNPVPLWEWVEKVLNYSGLPPLKRKIPSALAYGLASVCEFICRHLPGTPEPPLTKFLVSEMYTSHYFNITAARRDLGYAPSLNVWQALEKTFT
jgi:2-alkyl-3-oxoalkanoate reductase